jgi:hypothetical protein
LGDFAVIEFYADRTLSLHPPLVGIFSVASSGVGHAVHDPGPLSLWMLAVPVHIDPTGGLIWGSALWSALALSVAIEAIWSTRQWVGCVLIGLTVVDLLWIAPSFLEGLAWNAYFPFPFLVVAVAGSYAVARGRFGWWPVVAAAASVAAETHLFYVLVAVGLVLVAPVIAWWSGARPVAWTWMYAGMAVGGVCWLAPMIQALGPDSNVAALARGTNGAPTLGLRFGLRMVGDAAGLSPIWGHLVPTRFFPAMSFAFGHSAVYGIVVMGFLVAVLAYGVRTRRFDLVAAATLTLVLTVGFAASFAMIPAANLIVVSYLLVLAWPMGIAIWILTGWVVVSFAGSVRSNTRVTSAVLVGLMACGTALAIVRTIPADPNFGTNWSPQEASQVGQIVSFVEATRPPSVTVVLADTGKADEYWHTAIGEGVALRLVLDGRHPFVEGLDSPWITLPRQAHSVRVKVLISGDTIDSLAVETQ